MSKNNDKSSKDERDPLAHFRKPFQWGDAESSPPKKGEIKMFTALGNGSSPSAPAANTQAAPMEKEHAEAMQDPEFEKLCQSMGITAKDAVRFHKLMNER